MKYVIIGNSAAGLSACETIKRNDPSCEITIVSEETYSNYSRPLISYYLKDKVSKENMFYRDEAFYPKHNVELILANKAVDIDSKAKKVVLADGACLSYDKLLLATGSIPFVPPVEGMKDQENIFTFLSMKDSEQIKVYAQKDMKVVIVGGGLIGLKAAEGLSKICSDITVLELFDRLLATILDKKGSDIIGNHIASAGVKYLLGDTATKIQGYNKVESLVLKSGKTIPCDLLVMAVGVRPNVELAQKAGITLDRGIVTNEYLETSVKDIFAAGDCTVSLDVIDGNRKILALWPNAVFQGKIAGENMAGNPSPYNGGFPMNAIDFFGLQVMTCGVVNSDQDYEIKKVEGEHFYKKFSIKDDILAGYILIGSPERAGIYNSLVKNKTKLSTLQGDMLEPIGIMHFTQEERNKKIYGV